MPRLSLLSVMAFALATVAQLTALVHMGVVRHEICADHGSLVEVVGHHAAEQDHADRDTLFAASHSETDDHCFVAHLAGAVTCVRSSFAPDQPPAPSRIRSVDPVPLCEVGLSSLSVLSVAPKTSPPVRAV